MRTSDVILSISLLGVAFGLSPAVSFDGTRTPEGSPVAVPAPSANLAPGSNALGAATPLAAVPVAPLTMPPSRPLVMPPTPQDSFRSGTQLLRQGKIDQAVMELEYAAEQGVPAAISGTPNARFLANAFVTLGLYYLEGIPGTLKSDPNVAREMFHYAASYFADPEAQYYLARQYLQGKGAPKDAITAARWLQLSAEKGDHP